MVEHLRQVIRSILMEELAQHGIGSPSNSAPAARVEEVEINSDDDLARFVRRLLKLSKNSGAVSDIESGRHVFRLRAGGSAERPARR